MAIQEYHHAYDAVADKHGIGLREMLVLLKAYAQYKADEQLEKPMDQRGWMNAVYDIVPMLNCFGKGCVHIPNSFFGAMVFWEPDLAKAQWRLSEKGLAFVNDNPKLYDAAATLLRGVF